MDLTDFDEDELSAQSSIRSDHTDSQTSMDGRVAATTPIEFCMTSNGIVDNPEPIAEQLVDSLKSSAHPISFEDEFDIFGKFIAGELRTIDLSAARSLKLKINLLMANEMLALMDNN